jgi:hypothetical protein
VQISTHIKISDPNTGKVLLQKRGDIWWLQFLIR